MGSHRRAIEVRGDDQGEGEGGGMGTIGIHKKKEGNDGPVTIHTPLREEYNAVTATAEMSPEQ